VRQSFVFLLAVLLSSNLLATPTPTATPAPQAEPGIEELYNFELGEIVRPKNTIEKTLPTDNGITHLLIRGQNTNSPAVFVLTVTNDGASLDSDSSQALKAFSRSYCDKLAAALQLQIESVDTVDEERGCSFTFRIRGSNLSNYGRVFLGRKETLVIVGLGTSRREATEFINSFESNSGRFERPLTRQATAYRVTAGYSWVMGAFNLLLGIIGGCISMLLDRSFLVACRNTLIVCWLAETLGGSLYSYHYWGSLEITWDMTVGAFAGLSVTTGGPAFLCQALLVARPRFPSFRRK
jgi:hypothetical protein